MRYRTIYFIIIIILLKIVSTVFIPVVPSIDEAFQIQAGIRLSEGKGLTASMDDLSLIRLKTEKDLSKNIYNYLTNLAPLESLIIALLNLLGLFSLRSLGIIGLLFFALGIIGWYLCLKILYPNKIMQLMCICALFGVFYIADGTSMFTWAIFSYISLIFLKIQNGEERNVYYFYLVMFSIISIYFRYQALAFSLSVPVLILLLSKSKQKLLISLFSGLIIIGSYIALNVFNRKMGIDLFSTIMFDFQKADFTLLPKYLFFLIPMILSGKDLYGHVEISYSYYIIAFVINILFLFILIHYKNKLKIILYVTIPVFIITFFLLFYSSVMLKDFMVLLNGRYWWFLTPLFFIILLKPIDSFLESRIADKKIIKRVLNFTPALMLIAVISLSLLYNYKLHNYSKQYNENELLTSFLDAVVKKQQFDPENLIIFTGMDDQKGLSSMLLIDNKYATFRRLEILKDEKLYLSGNEKILLMIEESTDLKKYLGKNMYYTLLDTKHGYKIYWIDFTEKKVFVTWK